QGRAVIAAVHGRGGVGKSALAVRAAHAVAAEYPDGQLYIDLHGSTPGLRPRTAHEVLDRCLRGLGVPAAEVPPDESDAAARWRTLTAGRRVLLVLDNATDPSQVLPALPASAGCAAIVTSRRLLATLDADGYLALDGPPEAPAPRFPARTPRPPIDRAAYQIFPTLGLLPVPQLHPVTVAAMLGEPDTHRVARGLDRLVEVRLLDEAPLRRYRQHDLVRLVAGECAVQVLAGPVRD